MRTLEMVQHELTKAKGQLHAKNDLLRKMKRSAMFIEEEAALLTTIHGLEEDVRKLEIEEFEVMFA